MADYPRVQIDFSHWPDRHQVRWQLNARVAMFGFYNALTNPTFSWAVKYSFCFFSLTRYESSLLVESKRKWVKASRDCLLGSPCFTEPPVQWETKDSIVNHWGCWLESSCMTWKVWLDLLYQTLESDNSKFHQFPPRNNYPFLFIFMLLRLDLQRRLTFCSYTCFYSFLHVIHRTASSGFLKQKSHTTPQLVSICCAPLLINSLG